MKCLKLKPVVTSNALNEVSIKLQMKKKTTNFLTSCSRNSIHIKCVIFFFVISVFPKAVQIGVKYSEQIEVLSEFD